MSAIGTQTGTSNISIGLSGARPTDSLNSGHYYELVPVFTSTYEGGTDAYLPTPVTGIIIVDTTTSVNVALSKTELMIYPNPASRHLYIRQDGMIPDEDIRIYSLQGRLLLFSEPADRIDISGLSDGTYILKIGTSRMLLIKNAKD